MSELEQLKERIDQSGICGIETAQIRVDCEPAGDLMIRSLRDSGEYITRSVPPGSYEQTWKIFKRGFEPHEEN